MLTLEYIYLCNNSFLFKEGNRMCRLTRTATHTLSCEVRKCTTMVQQ